MVTGSSQLGDQVNKQTLTRVKNMFTNKKGGLTKFHNVCGGGREWGVL